MRAETFFKKQALIIILSIIITASISPARAEERFVLGYYPAGVKDRLPAENLNFTILTHICHAFIMPDADGSIFYRENFLYPELVEAVHKAGRKILVSVGGGGGGKAVESFAPVAADRKLRARFIKNLIEFCGRHGYDGIDFDWEYPRDSVQRADHATLVTELRQATNKLGRPFLITMANSANLDSDKIFDYEKLKNQLDWFNVMTYDFHGHWSSRAGHNAPLYSIESGSDHTGIQYLMKDIGIPPEKLLLGLPFYGFLLNAAHINGPSDGGRYIGYNETILKFAGGGWNYHWDTVSLVPYMTDDQGTQLITFDNPKSIALKCDYARVSKLRGVMIWALGYDLLEDKQPLLETVGRKTWDTDTNR
ncbi:MAG TPA: glycoside hydrolase family 18 protein [archaeon]|nr:glycoside hydrolase family 18 protein [archaeon]